MGKAGKIVRLVRVMRVMRIFKLVRHFAGLQSLIYTLNQDSATFSTHLLFILYPSLVSTTFVPSFLKSIHVEYLLRLFLLRNISVSAVLHDFTITNNSGYASTKY